jgi:hypothetical protein
MQLEIGTPEPFLELDFDTYGNLVTHCCIGHLWQYLSEQKVTLQPGISPVQMQFAHSAWIQEPTHQGLQPGTSSDQFLMPLFVTAGYQGYDLFALNVCRIGHSI